MGRPSRQNGMKSHIIGHARVSVWWCLSVKARPVRVLLPLLLFNLLVSLCQKPPPLSLCSASLERQPLRKSLNGWMDGWKGGGEKQGSLVRWSRQA